MMTDGEYQHRSNEPKPSFGSDLLEQQGILDQLAREGSETVQLWSEYLRKRIALEDEYLKTVSRMEKGLQLAAFSTGLLGEHSNVGGGLASGPASVDLSDDSTRAILSIYRPFLKSWVAWSEVTTRGRQQSLANWQKSLEALKHCQKEYDKERKQCLGTLKGLKLEVRKVLDTYDKCRRNEEELRKSAEEAKAIFERTHLAGGSKGSSPSKSVLEKLRNDFTIKASKAMEAREELQRTRHGTEEYLRHFFGVDAPDIFNMLQGMEAQRAAVLKTSLLDVFVSSARRDPADAIQAQVQASDVDRLLERFIADIRPSGPYTPPDLATLVERKDVLHPQPPSSDTSKRSLLSAGDTDSLATETSSLHHQPQHDKGQRKKLAQQSKDLDKELGRADKEVRDLEQLLRVDQGLQDGLGMDVRLRAQVEQQLQHARAQLAILQTRRADLDALIQDYEEASPSSSSTSPSGGGIFSTSGILKRLSGKQSKKKESSDPKDSDGASVRSSASPSPSQSSMPIFTGGLSKASGGSGSGSRSSGNGGLMAADAVSLSNYSIRSECTVTPTLASVSWGDHDDAADDVSLETDEASTIPLQQLTLNEAVPKDAAQPPMLAPRPPITSTNAHPVLDGKSFSSRKASIAAAFGAKVLDRPVTAAASKTTEPPVAFAQQQDILKQKSTNLPGLAIPRSPSPTFSVPLPPPPPAVIAATNVKTLFRYETADPEELPFESGQVLALVEPLPEAGQEWFMARNEAGQTGLIPHNYVVFI